MILLIINIIDYEEIECKLELNEMKITNEEIQKKLFNKINEKELNGNLNINNNNKNNLNEEKKEMNKEKEIKEEETEENENSIQNNNFKENPQNLKFKEYLTNNHSTSNAGNFDVFIGLKDHIEYLIFNNKNNYNLEIMRIKDKAIITSLKGHNSKTTVIRYYLKDNKEEYILSCDNNKLVIIWDLQNYYKKYTIQSEYNYFIGDALLLFNIFNNTYILLSSYKDNEYNKLYEFKENTKFIKNIYGTNEHNTYYMIPWLYQDKYYIINCYKGISINNIFEDEKYVLLSKDVEGCHYWGYIFKSNFLCVSDYDKNCIKIWDLVNKVIYKQINYDASYGVGIIPWNNNYAIVGCKTCFVVINIEESKSVKKVTLDSTHRYNYVFTVRKIRTKQLGECLIYSDDEGNIKLFSL